MRCPMRYSMRCERVDEVFGDLGSMEVFVDLDVIEVIGLDVVCSFPNVRGRASGTDYS